MLASERYHTIIVAADREVEDNREQQQQQQWFLETTNILQCIWRLVTSEEAFISGNLSKIEL